MNKKFVPVYEYAKKVGKSQQEVYRLIREGRFNKNDLTRIEKVVERIVINEDAEYPR